MFVKETEGERESRQQNAVSLFVATSGKDNSKNTTAMRAYSYELDLSCEETHKHSSFYELDLSCEETHTHSSFHSS